MIKVAMIGAGSVVFSKNLAGDILSYPELARATLACMDLDRQRLDVGAALCRKVARALGAQPTIQSSQDLAAALDGADFVINMAQVGGFDATLADFEIPRKYGLNFTIADTTGPGAMFRALRTYPMLQSLLNEMERRCPRALLLNYANPMGMNMQTITRTGTVRAVGLCHSVQGTLDQVMSYVGERSGEVAFTCAGINHMAFYLQLEKNGVDLYPRLFEAMKTPHIYDQDRVRFEIMRRLGYFVTESSEHSAEYCPWFIPHGRQTIAKFGVPIDEYLRRCECHAQQFARMQELAGGDEPIEVHRSCEYGSTIIHAMVTGRPAIVYGNMPNRGSISNLPHNAIAEVPTMVDRAGPRLTTVGELPPQVVGYIQPHVQQQELFIRAAAQGRRDHVYQAAMLDPLTAAMLPPDRIIEMCDELIAAHGFEQEGGRLPPLDSRRTLVPMSGRSFDRPSPEALRQSWNDAQAAAVRGYLERWHVIGPFFGSRPDEISLDEPTPLEDVLFRAGAPDRAATIQVGARTLKWKPARARATDAMVDLAAELGAHEFCIAYGVAEIDALVPREVLLECGSDDGIRIAVNGEIVLSADRKRAYRPGSDAVHIRLKPGINRIVVKVTNWRFGWGFGVGILDLPAR